MANDRFNTAASTAGDDRAALPAAAVARTA